MNDSLLHIDPDQYAVITLDRPNKLNSVSLKMVQELDGYLDELQNRSDLKFLVVTGSGDRAFCSGGDLNDFHGDMTEEEAYQLLSSMKSVLYKLATLHIPTIAWMNGLARGGGMEIASACDIRYAKPQQTLGFIQGQLGISTGWGGAALLYERIDPQLAFQWMIESDIKTSEESLNIGFIQKIMSDTQISRENSLLQPFLNRSYEQMMLWKKQRLSVINLKELNSRMDSEVKGCSRLWVSEDHKEAVKQFLSKK